MVQASGGGLHASEQGRGGGMSERASPQNLYGTEKIYSILYGMHFCNPIIAIIIPTHGVMFIIN